MVVDNPETMIGKYLFQLFRPASVFFYFRNEIERPVCRCFEHGSQCELCRMACAGRQGIQNAVDVHGSERSAPVALCQSGIGPVIQFVGDCRDADTLAGVAECF